MSARYATIGWTRSKILYDAVLLGAVALYILCYLEIGPALQHVTLPPDPSRMAMQAYGSCALLLLTLALSIGPLARLDPRFLPLLYNRRHLGVITFAVALGHVFQVLGWYFAYSETPPLVGLLGADTAFGQLAGFPFIPLGIAAFLILAVLAATSHDFWLSFLTPPVWKAMHMAIYPAYALAVAHVGLGALQDARNPALAMVLALCVAAVCALHMAAAAKGRREKRAAAETAGWIDAGAVAAIPEDRGITIRPPGGGEAVAIFRHAGRLSAMSSVCAHQNGPLGEGRVVDGCVVCPWHGYQYRMEDGCSPPPYTERVATYRLRVAEGRVLLDPRPNPPGTPVEPVPVTEPAAPARDAAPFFIGWETRLAPGLRGVMALTAAAVLAGAAGLGLLLSASVDDPGGGEFLFADGPKTLRGAVTALPYPTLHLPPDAANPGGRFVLLSGVGKSGVEADPALEGRLVEATGVMLRRGPIEQMQVEPPGLTPVEGEPGMRLDPVPLGRWRITGEICDGKCWNGAMRPGGGISHRACANFCLLGGVPPLFVTTRPVAGSDILLLGGPEGGPIPQSLLDQVGLRVTLEGRLERRGTLPVFLVDPASARLAASDAR